jgi:hypothetical protein
MQVIAQILFKILISLATEKVFRELIATGLDQITKHTNTPIDNEIAAPIIAALRGDS